MRTLLAGFTTLLMLACAAPETSPEVRPLVDSTWLDTHLDAVVVLDIRRPQADPAFAVGHIPGSVHSPYGGDPGVSPGTVFPG
jgi:rhodanese-related sulfurtransferase